MLIPLVDFYPNTPMPSDHTLAIVITLFVLVPFVAYLILQYVLQGLGLSKLATRRGIHRPWLAWVPFGRNWLLGSLSDQYQYLANGKLRYNRRWLLGLSIPTGLYTFAFYVFFVFVMPFAVSSSSFETFLNSSHASILFTGFTGILNLLSIGLIVFRSLALFDLFASSYPRYKVPLLLISIFLETSTSFLIFAVRDNDSGMPPRRVATPNEPE